ncbi:MAG: BrnA antitoxin family protein [Anaerolineae bacterium]|nr:BrnA antitoxin family protein [Anaerolineae bacterium]
MPPKRKITEQGENSRPKLPEFKSEAEEIAWFDTHDTSEYMDDLEEVDEPFTVIQTRFKTPLNVTLPLSYADAIESYAARQGLTYQAVVRAWLIEKLQQEAPDLMPQ